MNAVVELQPNTSSEEPKQAHALLLSPEQVRRLEGDMSEAAGAVDASKAVVEAALAKEADPFLKASDLLLKDALEKANTAASALFEARATDAPADGVALSNLVRLAAVAVDGATSVLIENMNPNDRSLWCSALLLQRTAKEIEKIQELCAGGAASEPPKHDAPAPSLEAELVEVLRSLTHDLAEMIYHAESAEGGSEEQGEGANAMSMAEQLYYTLAHAEPDDRIWKLDSGTTSTMLESAYMCLSCAHKSRKGMGWSRRAALSMAMEVGAELITIAKLDRDAGLESAKYLQDTLSGSGEAERECSND
ncbi:hypothetical protein [Pseudacidovorax intermedius]|uniref:hypothetical protein n=1 Tax=Pseudacidovorax intermedius TaxID=433924 RepID=UPI0012DD4A19|nr:hypothetical protein [Pseudacidovorax intermedius]